MREQLIGYLLDALDTDEARAVEATLADPERGAALRRDLDLLRRAVGPLAHDREPVPAPGGLAARTLAFVASQTGPAVVPLRPLSPASDGPVPSRRVWLDRALLAASALAACILVVPLVAESVVDSRARRAERRLQVLGQSLQGYAESRREYPTPPDGGPLSRAGLYAPMLVSDRRLVADDGTVLVPGSELARRRGFRVPTVEELEAAVGTPGFEEMVRSMGGDFGYTLGHRDAAGRLQPIVGLNRAHHPLMADAPDASGERSDNHADGLHHVLWEDGRVDRLHESRIHVEDHLFLNHDGQPAAGKDPEDAVIGDSHHQP